MASMPRKCKVAVVVDSSYLVLGSVAAKVDNFITREHSVTEFNPGKASGMQRGGNFIKCVKHHNEQNTTPSRQ